MRFIACLLAARSPGRPELLDYCPMRVLVIGGGISGLASAFRVREALKKANIQHHLEVLEAEDEVGGTIRTFGEEGWRVESGPNGFLDSKPGALRLVEALGLEDRLLPADHAAKKRFIFVDGRLRKLPTSAGSFICSPVLPFFARLRFALEPLMPRGPKDESVADLGRRRIGPHAVERLLDPMVSGIFAGDVEKLSVASAFPAVKNLEMEHGSLILGMLARMRRRRRESSSGGNTSGGPAGPGGHLNSLVGGMGELLDALKTALGDSIETGVRVDSVVANPEGGYLVFLEGSNEPRTADIVISAAPAHSAAAYLSDLDADLAGDLASISYAPISVVAVGLREDVLERPLDGFGFLIPSCEREQILGCLFDSSIYPGHRAPPGHVLTRTMVGGARSPELALLSDEELVNVVKKSHHKTMGLYWDRPSYLRVFRYQQGIPQYPVGHSRTVARIDSSRMRHPGLYVMGNFLSGVGVNDCSSAAEEIAAMVASRGSERTAQIGG